MMTSIFLLNNQRNHPSKLADFAELKTIASGMSLVKHLTQFKHQLCTKQGSHNLLILFILLHLTFTLTGGVMMAAFLRFFAKMVTALWSPRLMFC